MRLASLAPVLASFAMAGDVAANPQARIAVGAGQGSPPRVTVYDGDTPRFDFLAYGASFFGGVRVALGDVSGDGVADLVTAPAAGTGQRAQVYDGVTGIESWGFYPFTSFHTAGIHVAAGDVNGDGRADVVAGSDADAGPNGGPRVKVFDGATRASIADFNAFDLAFRGGVRVAAGDVNGDGLADLVLGTGPGAGTVKVVDANGAVLVADFQPFGSGFTGGVFVAAGDVDGDGSAEIVVGPDENAAHVNDVITFDSEGNPIANLTFADLFPEAVDGGVRVATGLLDTDALADVLFGSGPSPVPNFRFVARAAGDAPSVRRLRGFDQLDLGGLEVFDASFTGGVFVAASPIATPEADCGALAVLCLALDSLRRAQLGRRSH